MKFTKYFMPLAAVALLASCSNDNKLDVPQDSQMSQEGTMFASFNIKMPAQKGTRAWDEDDNFYEGTDAEYAATGGYIILFKAADGENETNFTDDDAIFVQKAQLTSLAWGDKNQNENITTTSTTATAQFPSLTLSDDVVYLGLIVLNPTADFPMDEEEDLIKDVTKFGDWKKIAHQNSGNIKKGFVMTNAPDYMSEHTLVYLDQEEFAQSLNEIDKPAATFYVQREVAKVSLACDEDAEDITVDVKTTTQEYYNGDQVVFDSWQLDITNAYTYPVQNFDADWFTNTSFGDNSRFYGSNSDFYRIYWAIDPNYSDADLTDEAYEMAFLYPSRDEETPFLAVNEPAYCNENTFDKDHMLQIESTRAIFKGKYIINGESDAVDFITYGKLRVAVDDYDILLEESTPNVCLTDLVAGWDEDEEVVEEGSDLETLMAEFAVTDPTVVYVDYFKDGVVYYSAVIRHFDDDATYWDSYKDTFINSSIYTDEQVGRYGVVRNNWYEMNISSVAGPGKPIIPEDPDPEDPDDPGDKEKYIDVEIHILSWAKRAFDYDL